MVTANKLQLRRRYLIRKMKEAKENNELSFWERITIHKEISSIYKSVGHYESKNKMVPEQEYKIPITLQKKLYKIKTL